MQTIKTGVVVALLLAVCYGAFVALNAPEPNLPDELLSEFDWNPDDAALEGLMDIEMPSADSMANLDIQTPQSNPRQDSGIPAASSLGALDTQGLKLPTLPSLHSTSPIGSTPGVAVNPAQSNNSPFAASATLPSNSASIPPINPQSSPSMGSLPSLPTLPTGTVAAADGPAIALNGIPTNPSAGATSPPQAFEFQSPVAQGQLVSQTKPSPTTELPGIQLPLLGGPAASSTNSNSTTKEPPTLPFATAREQALEMASMGKLRDALQSLSGYYNSPELNSTQHADLVDLLDALSKEVIYSPRHLVDSPYAVKATDTIESLSAKYQITAELFAAINGLGDSKAMIDGSQVKVLPGPFRAVVSIGRQELTVFLGELYAGRFPVSFGKDPSPVEGTFEIVDRRRDRTYYGTGGKVIPAGDPRNPYGGYWLNLGQDLCIHGTPEMASDDLQGAGCISLAPLDAADVYSILSQTSQVSIVR